MADSIIADKLPSIALVGCGAIAQAFYLPALANHREKFDNVWLVDPGQRARGIAASAVRGKEAASLRDVGDDIELAIIATPNHLHFPLALEAMSRGANVLIEKPFVISPDEGQRLIQAAETGDRVLAINQTRRLLPLTRDLRDRIGSGEFGSLVSVIHREGTKLTWPFESGAAFAPGAERTGVIMDFGVHVLDFYQYLLRPSWSFHSAIHDGFAGPEGLAEIELTASGARVSLRLSRYQPQENIATLTFENAEITFSVYATDSYSIRPLRGKVAAPTTVTAKSASSSPAELLLLNFLAACDKREPAVCDGASSLPVIQILDAIYESAGRYPEVIGAV